MNRLAEPRRLRYFPAVVCSEHDSPVDALLALCVPRDEVMALVVASWSGGVADCLLARLDGGRAVAAVRAPDDRWLACNAFLEHCCATRGDAERRLAKLGRRGRRACVGVCLDAADEKKPAR